MYGYNSESIMTHLQAHMYMRSQKFLDILIELFTLQKTK
jgi:hypothetical protein